MWYVFSIEVTK